MVVLAFLLMVGTLANAIGQTDSQGTATAGRPISFDIPAQPLASAVDAYTTATGLEVIFDSNLAAAYRSTAVNGVLAPDVALRVLLEGTGLTVLYAVKAFAIVPMPSKRQSDSASLVAHIPYLAVVQDNVERAFCRHPETMPGQYRLAVRFGIGAAGEVRNSQVLSSTGDLRRDMLIAGLLRGLSIDEPPPPGMPQPITMIISPRSPAQTGDCGSAEGRPQPRTTQ